MRHHVCVQPVSPHLQLVYRRGPERVPCADQHRLAHPLVVRRHLGDARRLSGAVHPDDHEHERLGGQVLPVVPVPEALVLRVEKERQLLLEQFDDLLRVADALLPDTLTDAVHHPQRRFDAYVRGDERVLQVLPQPLVRERRALEQRRQPSAPALPCFGQGVCRLVLTAEEVENHVGGSFLVRFAAPRALLEPRRFMVPTPGFRSQYGRVASGVYPSFLWRQEPRSPAAWGGPVISSGAPSAPLAPLTVPHPPSCGLYPLPSRDRPPARAL